MRLDVKVGKILNISRNKASELIKKGFVEVDGKSILKPSFLFDEQNLHVKKENIFVSRAGEKLNGFLEDFSLSVKDKTCLDVGSSTGGFVQVLLQYGAKKVVAVDVGSEQLHVSLRQNEKVELYEKTDIRDFTCKESFDIVTCDVSFISFKDISFAIDSFAKEYIIILFKPQFEVGRGVKRDKKGVVSDKKAVQNAREKFEKEALSLGWILEKKADSKLKGKEGNLESFYAFRKM